MDWITIISIIASALSGGVLTYFINPRAAWKKPEIDNKAAEVQTSQTQFQSYNDSMGAMQSTILSQETRNKELFELNVQAHDEINKLKQDNDLIIQNRFNKLKSDLMQCSMALCRNSLCPLREPEKGLGDEIFQQCKKDKVNFLDNKEIEDIAKEKGYTLKKIEEV